MMIKPRRPSRLPTAALALIGVLSVAPRGFGQDEQIMPVEAPPLAWGEMQAVNVKADTPAMLVLQVDEPGIVTLTATSERADLWLSLADDTGQELYDGSIDFDPAELPNGEFGSVAATRAGQYVVLVGSYENDSPGQVRATFAPTPGLVHQPDPQGDPRQAVELMLDVPLDQTIDHARGDHRDWFKFIAPQSGEVRFATRVPEGSETDLILESFEPGRFYESAWYADDDVEGTAGREQIELTLQRGEAVYLRVDSWDDFAEQATPYTIEATWATPPRGRRAPVNAEPGDNAV